MATSAPLKHGTSSAATYPPMLLDAASKNKHRQVAYWQHSRNLGRHNERYMRSLLFILYYANRQQHSNIIFFIKPAGKYYLHNAKFK